MWVTVENPGRCREALRQPPKIAYDRYGCNMLPFVARSSYCLSARTILRWCNDPFDSGLGHVYTENDFTRICCDSRPGFGHSEKCLQREVESVGKHSIVRGEASTKQGIDSLHGRLPNYDHKGKHRAEDKIAGSDVPPRDGTDRDRK